MSEVLSIVKYFLSVPAPAEKLVSRFVNVGGTFEIGEVSAVSQHD
jgi:hypothetical protein